MGNSQSHPEKSVVETRLANCKLQDIGGREVERTALWLSASHIAMPFLSWRGGPALGDKDLGTDGPELQWAHGWGSLVGLLRATKALQ